MRIFVTGAAGQLGRQLPGAFAGHDIIAGLRPAFDLTHEAAVRTAIVAAAPDLVIHAGAYTDVDGCERDPDRAYQTNALGTRYVALAARAAGARLVVVSSDYVFDGTKADGYVEWDEPRPLSVYGRSKLAGEREAQTLHPEVYVVRTSWVYSSHGRNFVKTMLRLASERSDLTVVDDECSGPTLAADLAEAIARLVQRPVYGVYHLANAGSCSRYALATAVVEQAGLAARVTPTSTAAYLERYPMPARRPAHSTLRNLAGAAIGVELRPWADALTEFLRAYLGGAQGARPR
jgi:dTDP-4-dehydrorhamnose reductase